MTIKVRITFKDFGTDGFPRLSRDQDIVVSGLEVPFSALTFGDMTMRIAETEAHLSRITGLVVKIETAAE